MKIVAVDYGTHYYVSFKGEHGTPHREPGVRLGTTRNCKDFVALVQQMFDQGYNVVTEASTLGSFRVRGRQSEIADLCSKYDLKVYTIGTKSCYNYAKKNDLITSKIEFNNNHSQASSLIWNIFNKNGGRIWTLPNPAENVQRFDPVRPNYLVLVGLRSDEYPSDLMENIYRFLPEFSTLTHDQQVLMSGGQGDSKGYADDQAAALVCSLTEPISSTRQGWERVLGSSRDGRPNIYRQMLVVGKPRKSYIPGVHISGLSMRDATRIRRNMRTLILNDFPGLPGSTIL